MTMVRKTVVTAIFGTAIAIYAFYGLSIDKIVIPMKRSSTAFDGNEVIWGFLTLMFVTFSFITVIVDHYDKRDNEVYCSLAFKTCLWSALAFLIIGIIVKNT